MSIDDFNSNDRVTLWAIIEHSPRSVADRLVSCLRHVVDICVSLSKARHCGRCLLYGDTWHRFSCSHIVHSRLAGPTHSERVISQSELTGKLNDTVQTWTGLTHWHLGYVEVIFQCTLQTLFTSWYLHQPFGLSVNFGSGNGLVQYHCCRCPAALMCQGISSHGIDLSSPRILPFQYQER